MVYEFLADGFEVVEALFPVDLLRRAGIEVATVGVTGVEVASSAKVTVRADLDGSRTACPPPRPVRCRSRWGRCAGSTFTASTPGPTCAARGS